MVMEAAKRWETEAIRESRDRRRGRPEVSQSRSRVEPTGEWVTLREAADATGIPINTLRKWCRRETVDSYLESDGHLTLRIVEMSSVRRQAENLGREITPSPETLPPPQGEVPPKAAEGVKAEAPAKEVRTDAPETMIVPVDAWNKMLTQLGNLHEAGQQLAEARERAAKAETEAKFLRERLADLRRDPPPPPPSTTPSPTSSAPNTSSAPADTSSPSNTPSPSNTSSPSGGGAAEGGRGGQERSSRGGEQERSSHAGKPAGETTSFFRYVVRGWRGRKR